MIFMIENQLVNPANSNFFGANSNFFGVYFPGKPQKHWVGGCEGMKRTVGSHKEHRKSWSCE